MRSLLTTLISLSAQAAVAGLLVMLARRLFGAAMPLRLRYALWALVLVKLLVPFHPPSPVSLYNLFNHNEAASAYVNHTAWATAPTAQAQAAYAPLDAPAAQAAPRMTDWAAIALAVMAAVSATLLLRLALCYWQLRVSVYKWRQTGSGHRALLDSAGLRPNHRADVVFTDVAAAPFVFGFMEPVIVLPARLAEDAGTLDVLILHEATHIRLNHHRLKLLTAVLTRVFWFNPFVALFCRALNRDVETHCDRETLKLTRDGAPMVEPARYVRALLSVAALPGAVGGFRAKRAFSAAFVEQGFKTRAKAVLSRKRAPRWAVAAAAVVAAALFATLLTGARPPERASLAAASAAHDGAEDAQAPPMGEQDAASEAFAPFRHKTAAYLNTDNRLDFEREQTTEDARGLYYSADAVEYLPADPPSVTVNGQTFPVFLSHVARKITVAAPKLNAEELAAIGRVSVSAGAASLRFAPSADGACYAILELSGRINGRSDAYTLLVTRPASPDEVAFELRSAGGARLSGEDAALTICLPARAFELLTLKLNGGGAQVDGNRFENLVASLNLAALDYDADALTGVITIDANNAALRLRVGDYDGADVTLRGARAQLAYPDDWADGAKKDDARETVNKTIGDGRCRIYINAEQSVVELR